MQPVLRNRRVPLWSCERRRARIVCAVLIAFLPLSSPAQIPVGWGDNLAGRATPPAGLADAVAVAAGYYHSVALRTNGELVTWGDSSATNNGPPGPFIAVEGGSDYTVALRANGTVASGGPGSSIVVVPTWLDSVVAIAAGNYQAIALRSNGAVVRFGLETNVPVAATNIVAISSRSSVNMAVTDAGWVLVWGSPIYDLANVPAAASNIIAVAAGREHCLALREDGVVIGWGNAPQSVVPVQATNIIAIAAGYYHSLAQRADGTWLTWGQTNGGLASIPTQLGNLRTVSAGAYHNIGLTAPCAPEIVRQPRSQIVPAGSRVALSAAGQAQGALAYSWYFNGTNLLSATNAYLILPDAQARHAGDYFAVVNGTGGAVTSAVALLQVIPSPAIIGVGPTNQTGINGSPVTFQVDGRGSEPLRYQWQFNGTNIADATNAALNISAVRFEDAGSYRVIVSNDLGTTNSAAATLRVVDLLEWGTSGIRPAAESAQRPRHFAVSINAQLAITSEGRAVWWSGATVYTNVPLATNLVSVAAGSDYRLALADDGRVWLWNNYQSPVIQPLTETNLLELAAGNAAWLRLTAQGSVMAQGFGVTTNIPTTATGLCHIAANRFSTSSGRDCAIGLRRDGRAVAWGSLGIYPATPPPSATNLVAVAVGSDHALALRGDGTVIAWGASGSWTNVPPGVTNVVAISAGDRFSAALQSDGNLILWGNTNQSSRANFPTNRPVIAVSLGSSSSALQVGSGEPRFVDQLGDLTAPLDRDFTLNALAVGRPPLSFRWFFNGAEIAGATASTLTLTNAQPQHAGVYSVIVSNAHGAITGLVANVTVAQIPLPPLIVQPPQGQTNYAGTNVTFTVGATAFPAPTFQWQRMLSTWPNFTNVVGAISPTLALSRVMTTDSGSYRVVVSNSMGVVTSAVATLTVQTPTWPVFTSVPPDRGYSIGLPAILRVAASGTEPISFQWRRNGTNLPGAIGATLAFGALSSADDAVYAVVASNAFGVTISPEFRVVPVAALAWPVSSGSSLYFARTNLPPSLTNAVGIAVGDLHALAVHADGRVSAWGAGFYGETNVPAGLTNATAVAAGLYHSLAVREDGTVVAWGQNAQGQCNVPASATNVIAVAGGLNFSLALRADGTVVAWGTNDSGQLNIPATATGIVAIAAGDRFALARRADNTLVAWGNNQYGQLQVPAGTSDPTNAVEAVAAGSITGVAVMRSGSLLQWGINLSSFNASGNNVAVSALGEMAGTIRSDGRLNQYGRSLFSPNWATGLVAIAIHPNVAVALRDMPLPLLSRQITNRVGLIGGTTVFQAIPDNTRPSRFQWQHNGQNLANATNRWLALGNLRAQDEGDYAVIASGANGAVTSRVAHLTVTPPPAPEIAQQPADLTVPAGTNATLRVVAAYGVPVALQWRWNGAAISGATGAQLNLTNIQAGTAGGYEVVLSNASGSVTSRVASVVVTERPPQIVAQPVSRTVALAFNTGAVFTVTASGSEPLFHRWQRNGGNLAGATQPKLVLASVSDQDFGDYRVMISNAFGVTTSATARLSAVPIFGCGANSYQQLDVPPSATNLISLASGSEHTLGLRSDGTVAVWGNTGYNLTNIPPSVTNVVAIAAGTRHSTVLRSDGIVLAWGGNNYYGETNVPGSATNIVALSSRGYHTVALRSDGTPLIWGEFSYVPPAATNLVAVAAGQGQSVGLRGDGTALAWNNSDLVPLPATFTNLVAIAAGYYHVLGLRADGTVVGWSSSAYNSSGSENIPTNLTGVVTIAAGDYHSVALCADGTAVGWGRTLNGQIEFPAGVSNVVAITCGPGSTLLTFGAFAPRLVDADRDVSIPENAAIVLRAAAAGLPPLSYHWLRQNDTARLSSSPWLSVDSLGVSDAGAYFVVASNQFGTATGYVGTVSVFASAPQITAQPANVVAEFGQSFALSVKSFGSSPLSWRWLADHTNLASNPRAAGVDGAVLRLSDAQADDSGSYRVVVTNMLGAATSVVARVKVVRSALGEALEVPDWDWTAGGVVPWLAQTNLTHDGEDALMAKSFPPLADAWLETTVSGPMALSFWWRSTSVSYPIKLLLDDVVVAASASSAAWEQRSVAIPAGMHRLRFSQTNIYSYQPLTLDTAVDSISIITAAPPVVVTQPGAQSAAAGSTVTWTATASGVAPYEYRWEFNQQPIAGATNAALSLANVQAQYAGSYRFVVSNVAGATTSQVAQLTVVGTPPALTGAASAVGRALGADVHFTATASGSEPMSYEWTHNGVTLPGVTGPALDLIGVEAGDAGVYRAVVRNQFGLAFGPESSLVIVPVAVWGYYLASNVPTTVGEVVSIGGYGNSCAALRRDGTTTVWGPSSLASTGPQLTGATSISFGRYFLLGVREDGTVSAVGSTSQLALATNLPAGLSNVMITAAGYDHALALRSHGTVVAWGNNLYGQATVPPGLTNVGAIACGYYHSLALRDDGTVVAWGQNGFGQCNAPADLTNAIAIAGGAYHSLALRDDGTVAAWGNGTNGQCAVPAGLTNVVAIAGGLTHSMALRADGTVLVWGDNSYGQTNVWPGLMLISAIAAGDNHCLALVGDGKPVFTLQPLARRLAAGRVRFDARAVGGGALDYQWQVNDTNVMGATNAWLIMDDLVTVTRIRCTVSNALGVTVSRESSAGPRLQFLPLPHNVWLDAAGFHLRLAGLSGKAPVVIFCSTNLTAWQRILTNPPVVGTFEFIDADAGRARWRMYRAAEMEVDYASPSFSLTALPVVGGWSVVRVQGLSGAAPLVIEVSTNLVDWTPAFTNSATANGWQYAPPAPQPDRLFFRGQTRP